MLTTIAAYGSFILAERVHVSPVIAVLLTGMIIGNYGRRQGMSPNTEVAVDSFWEYAAFVVNSLVFLLIGIELQFSMLGSGAGFASWISAFYFAPCAGLSKKPAPSTWAKRSPMLSVTLASRF